MAEDDKTEVYVSKERLWAKVGCPRLLKRDSPDFRRIGMGRVSAKWIALFRCHYLLGLGFWRFLIRYER